MKKFTLKYFIQTLFVFLLTTQLCFAQWVRTSEPFSNWIYAFTANGSNLFFGMDSVYLSTDNGTNWSVVNSGLPTTNLYIISFGVSPDGANLFAGTMNNGVFLTTNNGTSWTEVNSGLPENGWVSDFAFCSNSRGGTDFFVDTRSEGVGGVFLSTNNGINWNKISTGILGASSLAVIQSDEGQTNLFVGGTYGAGLLRLTEKDTSWIEDMVITNNSIFSLAVSGTNLFASTDDGVILSTDNGTSWTMINPNLESIDAFSFGSNGTNFLVGVGNGDVYTSANNGTTWTDINDGFPSNIGVFKFAVSYTYIFAATDSGVWRRPLTEIITSVNIPDKAFLNALIAKGVDTNKDSLISYAEAKAVISLNVSGNWENKGNISDMTGIEAFLNLDSLDCSYNQLTSLDVSNNTALTDLNCIGNQLTSLDVSSNTALTELNCIGNQLTSLDVSNNTALERLYCFGNQLTSIDVTKNTSLSVLSCFSNQLTTIDVSKNTSLNGLHCGGNQLTSIDVTKNTALQYLDCSKNQLTNLDVSKDTTLVHLDCESNQLTNLDISKNTTLSSLHCGSNQLTTLDVSKNTTLVYLYCQNNQLTSLDVSKNTVLGHLNCSGNQLTNLDVSQAGLSYGDVFWGGYLNIANMPDLHQVCVRELPFPPAGLELLIDTTGSPNVYFTNECSGSTGVEPEFQETTFYLEQNYPNPFNTVTTIKYSIPVESKVAIKIYDLIGKEIETIVNEKKPACTYEVIWHAGNLPGGVYFYQLNSGGIIETRKMLLHK